MNKTRGYITVAENSASGDYLRMAYALALSLKVSQTEVDKLAVCISPGMEVPNKYAAVFDEVIEMPTWAAAMDSDWKIHNKWKVYSLTPYEESVLLDADMIFPADVSCWWNTLHDKHVWACSTPVTFRGEPIRQSKYRADFTRNSLPNIYTAFLYFKQSEFAHEYFNLVRDVYQNWSMLRKYYDLRKMEDGVLDAMNEMKHPDRFRWSHFFQNFPSYISGDLTFSVAMKIMGSVDQFTDIDVPFPSFVHMKSKDQGFECVENMEENWNLFLQSDILEDGTLLVGNYVQRLPFHYHRKEFLTDMMIERLESLANV